MKTFAKFFDDLFRQVTKDPKAVFEKFKQWIDELIQAVKKELGLVDESIGKFHIKTFLESEALTKEELLNWAKKIKSFSKSKCEFILATDKKILDYMDKYEALAYFDAGKIPPRIYYREGATEYVISHEYYHLEEFEILGKAAYLEGAFGTVIERNINTILREKYVFQKIIENAEKFSVVELRHAKYYYERKVVYEAFKRGVELKPEYIVKFKI